MTLPPRLEKELDELREAWNLDVGEEGDFILVTIHEFPLGDGYSKTQSDMLFQAPRSYPDAGPDMFWVDQDVTLAGGAIPQAADTVAMIGGKNWRRFSWHRAAWTPSVDNLHSYVEFIRRRLNENK